MDTLQIEQLGSDLLMWLSQFNSVDIVLALFLGMFALDGMRRGFIAGILHLVGIAATLFIALQTYRLAGAFLADAANMPPLVADVAGFFVVLLVAQVLMAILVRFILLALAPVRLLLAPLMPIDHALGIVPGVAQAAIIATLVLVPLQAFPVIPQVSDAIGGSTLAQEMPRRVTAFAPRLDAFTARAASAGSFYPSYVVEPSARVTLTPRTGVQPDSLAEAQMLVLVNAERAKAGLQPLVLDEQLRGVARAHSEEMFRLGYFGHLSPETGTPAQRLRRHGVAFRVSGENLAFAPTVSLAHTGLMNSPGHRRNILAPDYTRIGIGVMNAGFHGRMFTQNFAA